jgi:hypothetical protein
VFPHHTTPPHHHRLPLTRDFRNLHRIPSPFPEPLLVVSTRPSKDSKRLSRLQDATKETWLGWSKRDPALGLAWESCTLHQ